MSSRIEIAVYRGHELIGRRSFEGALVTIGAAPGCSLRFVGVEGVEYSHALVWDDGAGITIVPSGSAQIALNGCKVSIARPAPDDVIAIGPLDLRIERRAEVDSAIEVGAMVAHGPDDEGDEDEDPTFLEPFSLLDQVTRSSGVEDGELALQLVATRAGRLTELATIERASQYMPALPDTLARVTVDGTAELSFGRRWSARLRVRADGPIVERAGGEGVLRFAVGGCAILQDEDRTVLAFFVRRPRLAPEIGRTGLAKAALRHGAAAAAVHVALGLALLGLAQPDDALSAAIDPSPDRTDESDLYAYPLEEQAREPTPPVAAAPGDRSPPEPAATGHAAPAASRPRIEGARREPSPTGRALVSAPVADPMADLERLATAGPAVGSLRDTIGTIDVAPSSGGAPPGFRLAGPIGLPGAPVGLGGGRPGNRGPIDVVGTLGGRGEAGRFVAGPPPEGEDVAGRVTDAGGGVRPPPTIDRAEVQRVINRHQHEVVRCYERALLGSPSLSGTVLMGWTIAPGGGVAGVRVQRSTLASPSVTACISAAIRTWRFPSPQGGNVLVTFPWVLRPSSSQ